jgi:hypothetical protein
MRGVAAVFFVYVTLIAAGLACAIALGVLGQ